MDWCRRSLESGSGQGDHDCESCLDMSLVETIKEAIQGLSLQNTHVQVDRANRLGLD